MRLFVAIDFSDKTRERLFAAANELCTQGQGKLSPVENLHLTLVFLGETDHIDAAISALMEVSSPAFSLRFGSIGHFIDLYWAGISPNDALALLQAQLTDRFCAAGFSLEEREFLPHTTLLRRFTPNNAFSPADAEEILATIEESVSEIALMASHPCGNHMRYETLAIRKLNQI